MAKRKTFATVLPPVVDRVAPAPEFPPMTEKKATASEYIPEDNEVALVPGLFLPPDFANALGSEDDASHLVCG